MSDPSKKQVNAPVKQVVQPCPKPTIDLQYLDCKGNGIAGAKYQLYSVDVKRAKDGFYEKSGTLDSNGLAHISDVPELVGFVYYFEKDPKTYEPEEKPSKKPELAKAQSVLDSIGDWLVGAAQGDFNKEQTTGQLVANTLLGLVPIVDQVLDARDIVSGLKDIVEYYMEDEASQKSHPDELGLDYELWIWINVFIIAIGCIPIVGSAVKGVLKGVLHYLKKAGKVATKLSPHQLRVGWEYLVAILNKFGVGNAHQWLKTEFPSKIDGWMKEASGIIKRGLDSIMESADTAVKGVKFFSTEKAALVAKRVEEYKKAINKAKSKVDEMSSKVKQWFKEQIGAITGGAHKSEHIGATGTKSNPVTNSRNQLQADAPDVNAPSRWKNSDGSIVWPPNRGFAGTPTPIKLKPGSRFDRYGYEGGTFVSPEGVPYSQRSLAPGTDSKPYNVYEVVKEFDGMEGKVAPWFGESGGGIQYELGKSIKELLEGGYIKKVN